MDPWITGLQHSQIKLRSSLDPQIFRFINMINQNLSLDCLDPWITGFQHSQINTGTSHFQPLGYFDLWIQQYDLHIAWIPLDAPPPFWMETLQTGNPLDCTPSLTPNFTSEALVIPRIKVVN